MKTSATERIEQLVDIEPGMPNEDAYELIADKLEEQNQALKLAVEALEFYAEVSSWYINGSPKYLNHILDSDLQMADEPQPFSDQKGTFVGGKSARSALAEIRKLIGEK